METFKRLSLKRKDSKQEKTQLMSWENLEKKELKEDNIMNRRR